MIIETPTTFLSILIVALATCLTQVGLAGDRSVDSGFAAAPAVAAPACVDSETTPQRGGRAPRLAIVNVGAAAVLEDLLFERLAKVERLDLVERAQIGLILKEHQRALLSVNQRPALGKLLNADALLFLEPQPELTHLVLTETADGERLFDMVVPVSTPSYEDIAKVAAERIADLRSLLETRPREWRSLSVLPFQHDPQHEKWSDVKAFQTILQSHLVAMPGIILRERDYMVRVLHEKHQETDIALPPAHFLLEARSAVLSADAVRIDFQLRPVSRGTGRTVSYDVARANVADSVPTIAAGIRKMILREDVPVVAAEQEAAIHFANAEALRDRGSSDPFYSLELAHLLAPANREYQGAYLGALRERMDHTVSCFGQKLSLIERLEYFSRAMDLARRTDPERETPCLPLPAFMLSVSTNLVAPLSHGIAVLPIHDTRAPRIDEGQKTTRWINALLSETPAFRVVDERVVEATLETLNLRRPSYQFINNDKVALISKALNVRTVIKAGLYGDKAPVSLHFSIIGGCRSLNGNFTGSYTWDPHRQGFVSTAKQIVRLLDENLGYGDYAQMVTPHERERYEACRRQAKAYYEWYCDLAHGLRDPGKRSLLASVYPVFYDSPEAALASLRRLMDRYGSDAAMLTDSVFPRITYWDKRKARVLWDAFCQEHQRRPGNMAAGPTGP